MSEFLKFAFEILSQVVYNLVAWLAAFLKLFITGWVDYFNIFITYFMTLDIVGKVLSVLLMVLLIAIPLVIVVILIRHLILRHQLKADQVDNAVLYKEIGRLNKQVLSLMDEKNRILALKVNAMGGTERIPYMGASALTDDVLPTVGNVTGKGAAANVVVSGSGAETGKGAAVVPGNVTVVGGDGSLAAAAARQPLEKPRRQLSKRWKMRRPKRRRTRKRRSSVFRNWPLWMPVMRRSSIRPIIMRFHWRISRKAIGFLLPASCIFTIRLRSSGVSSPVWLPVNC